MPSNLSSQERLLSGTKFVRQMYATDKIDRPEIVVKQVMRWTKGQPLLTKKLLQYILETKSKISFGREAAIVEKTIRNRLIKEFKHDELTLPIRKLLYIKDLAILLAKTKGKVTERSQIYLASIQAELGLSERNCQEIKEHYLTSIFPKNEAERVINRDLPQFQKERSYQDLVSLIENSPIYHELVASDRLLTPKRWQWWQPPSFRFWLIPLCLLLVGGMGTVAWKTQELVSSADTSQPDNSCLNYPGVDSPRMSLGEKLLTKNKYSDFPIASKVALYEAIAAFNRCDYTVARSELQTSLGIVKNNPEALIYLNNTKTKAIAELNYKIAVSVPLGAQPEIAWEILRGVAQAQQEINQQGGINGKQLLIQIVDDDNDPAVVRDIAPQIAADSDILAIVGHNSSNASLAGADIYQQQGLVMISPTSSSTKLSGIGDYIMRTVPSVSVLADALSDYAAESSLTRIAVCSDSSSSASLSFTAEFTAYLRQNGGEVLDIGCDMTRDDFNPVSPVERALFEELDALLLATSVDTIDEAVAVAQANQNRLSLLGNHSLYTLQTTEVGKSAVANLVLSVPWLPETAPATNFFNTSKQLWGGRVNWRTAMTYDATLAIIQGLQQSDERTELKSVLTAPDFVVGGATGQFNFQQGDRQSQVQLAYIGKSPTAIDDYQFFPLKKVDNFDRVLP